ncbi:MAG: thioesterase [Flavobacteriia bacterium]|nr:MAG: thioesterase [Flavobacteriia bacterium]
MSKKQNVERQFVPAKLNRFLLVKLPSAYFTGIRIRQIDDHQTVVSVRHRWINQNPFRSLYFGVQAMAAELSTGVMVMRSIAKTGKRISMLVTEQKGGFYKKATGKITFVCNQGHQIDEVIQRAIVTGEGQKLTLTSSGTNTDGVEVSSFSFEWSIKVKP